MYIAGFAEGQQLAAIHTDTGQVIWQFHDAGGFIASPIVVDGKLLVGSLDKTLYCFVSADA